MGFLINGEVEAVVFILIFAIAYGILSRIKLFEEASVNALIALALGILVVFSTPVVIVIEHFVPYIALYILIVFFIIFILVSAFVPSKNLEDYMSHSSLFVGITIAIIFFIFIFAFTSILPSSSSSSGLSLQINTQFIETVIAFIVMIGVVYYVTRKPVNEK
ncbi:MAG: hypothetical protein QXX36_02320 [Candidatus Rehaiarchaeum fermentans]|nr:hypothetical protein [Candidatus Rehaiarchaeum fermentans]MCW1297065.1 hypothetical protein [Candidatus Rehaiarchaeum fermentans]MCW1302435.1 hypothetical protein [Candidatus Rehaiarchaeum fermentans]